MTIFSDETIIQNIYDDIGFEDITTNSLIDDNKWAQAEIICKEDGILAGIEIAHYIIDYFNLSISSSYIDGDEVHKGHTNDRTYHSKLPDASKWNSNISTSNSTTCT